MKPSGFVTIVAFIFGWLSGFMAISSSLPLMVIIPHFPELYGTTEKLPPKQILDIPINRTTAPLCAGLLVASLANTALSIG
ncbi:hypothetical protein LJC47_07930, partial [Desulfosarcina sp. OttesenSCG-928-B08]|nr:hypothetical protein [Desulfosarcina sp. OttesenSCG-928-B08]